MGDTLIYTNTSSNLQNHNDILPTSAVQQAPLPSALALSATNSLLATTMLASQQSQNAPPRERRGTEIKPGLKSSYNISSSLTSDTFGPTHAVILRKLPRNTGPEGVRNLLLFAKDLVNVRLLDSSHDEGDDFATAIARFSSYSGAKEVKDSLDGKMNATNDAKLVVELTSSTSPVDQHPQIGSRRNTMDGVGLKSGASSSASDQSSRQPSRYSSTFQSNERISPLVTNAATAGANDRGLPDGQAFHSFFAPQSPSAQQIRPQHNFGKSVINDDAVDDETDGIIRDPMSFMRGGRHQSNTRSSQHHLPTAQFAAMSMNASSFEGQSPLSGPSSGVVSPGSIPGQHAGSHYFSGMGGQNSYGQNVPGRTSYPAANPADQNPPCNTLYVGNLPNNTSEDELKRLFSQQRGYKRLCFRTKQNGPMCFVEFENVTLATQALHHLYGKMLSNSIKGGIRLSFSKNPLGVRSGQNGMPPNGMSPYGSYNAFGNDIQPPPGFASNPSAPPPGLSGRGGPRPPVNDGNYQAHQYSLSGQPFASQLRMPHPNMYPNGSPSPSSQFHPGY